MPLARSLTENVVANLIASSITGIGSALVGKANDLPPLSVALLGVGAFGITLLVLMFMAVRLDKRAKAEAALPLLREVGIHMLLNRPLSQGVLERFGENMVWWRDRTIHELTRAGASEYHISRFNALGTLEVTVAGETPAHAHARSVAATHVRRLEEAIAALRIGQQQP
jgi:hypothetical protein